MVGLANGIRAVNVRRVDLKLGLVLCLVGCNLLLLLIQLLVFALKLALETGHLGLKIFNLMRLFVFLDFLKLVD